MTSPSYWYAAILLLAFILGFQICKAVDRKTLTSLKRGIAHLRKRLQGAEDLLADKAMHGWPQIKDVDQGDAAGGGGVKGPDDRSALLDTQVYFPGEDSVELSLADLRVAGNASQNARVSIRKVIGKENRVIKLYTTVSGIEQTPPAVGERYRLMLEDGSYLNTSVVTKVSRGYFQTQNSVYEIGPLEPGKAREV